MGDRSSGREMAFKALFQWSFKMATVEQVLEKISPTTKGREEAVEFARLLMSGCAEHLEAVDAAIKSHSKNWDLERLGGCDRAALRLGTYELLFTETPAEVSINEAVELAKRYGDETSPKFVNGILDEIRKSKGAN